MTASRIFLVVSFIVTLVITVSNSGRPQSALPQGAFSLSSAALTPNGSIPAQYSCLGKNTSTPLSWQSAPAGTKSFALIMDDPDARPVVGYVWVHWVAYNIPPSVTALPAGLPKSATVQLQGGAEFTQGPTSWKRPGYGGPCPPKGTGVHHYHYTLYALSTGPTLPKGLTKEGLLSAMKGNVLAEAKLMGTFTRDK